MFGFFYFVEEVVLNVFTLLSWQCKIKDLILTFHLVDINELQIVQMIVLSLVLERVLADISGN